jgi:hypothetical protein
MDAYAPRRSMPFSILASGFDLSCRIECVHRCLMDLYGIQNAGLRAALDLRPRGLHNSGHAASGRSLRCSP